MEDWQGFGHVKFNMIVELSSVLKAREKQEKS